MGDAKVDESDFAKKVHKDKVKVKKVKAEAMRMTMDLGEEVKESKEMKKLKKSLIKKTDKVVHSLGIIIENKLAGLVDRKTDAKVDESDFAKKVHKDKVKVKKVKAEAMRMTMDLGEEVKESKEMKKLKKSL